MTRLLHCDVTTEQMNTWIDGFLAPEEPFYFRSDELQKTLLELGLLVYARSEFGDSYPSFGIHYGSNYYIWSVPRDVFVCALSSHNLVTLPKSVKTLLFQEQHALGRGQVYSTNWLDELLNDTELSVEDRTCCVDLCLQYEQDGGVPGFIVLTQELWQALPRSVQQAWVIRWVTEEADDNRDDVVSPSRIQHFIPDESVIARYVNQFPLAGGANCFAAATAPVLKDSCAGSHIIHRWLHEEPMYRLLIAQGYQRAESHCSKSDLQSALHPGDVLIWQSAQGFGIHGAYHVGDGVLFNKMGQCWHQPWWLLPVTSVFDYANTITDGGETVIYRR